VRRNVVGCIAAACFLMVGRADAQLGGLVGKAKNVAASKDAEQGKQAKKAEVAPETVQSFTGPKKRLAVMEMDVKVTTQSMMNPNPAGGYVVTNTTNIPMPSEFGTGLTEMLTTSLVNSNRFILLERKAMQDMQAEVALGAGGAVSPDSAVKMGGLLGAQAMIRGAVTEYSYRKSSTGAGAVFGKAVDLQRTTTEAMVALDIRIYDANTGQILDSVRADGKAKSSENSATIEIQNNKGAASSFSSTPLGAASREAIAKAVKFICDRMEKRPWEGAIAEIDAVNDKISALYLNAGKRAGIKEGDQFDILRSGRTIVNPETKVVIGRTKDTLIGRCKVESVDMDVAIAQPTRGSGFQRGDLIRFSTGGEVAPVSDVPNYAAAPVVAAPPPVAAAPPVSAPQVSAAAVAPQQAPTPAPAGVSVPAAVPASSPQTAGGAAATSQQPDLTAVKADFIPGEKTLFLDDLTDMTGDEPPPHWKVRGGTGELRVGQGVRQLTFKGRGVTLTPALTAIPPNFTMEADVVYSVHGNVTAWTFFDKAGKEVMFYRVSRNYDHLGVQFKVGEETIYQQDFPMKFDQPVKQAVWCQKGRLRLYVNGQRMFDVNQITLPEMGTPRVVIDVYNDPEKEYVGFRTVRFAESTPDFSQMISSAGRYVTHGILFDTGSDRLQPESAAVIRSIARGLETNPNLKLMIEGHTDSVGNADQNLDLSKRRAEAVKAVLVSQFNVDAGRLTTAGLGATKPMDTNDTPAGRAQNRRVELVRQ
jgi:OOP family OmpA-OmpF porin